MAQKGKASSKTTVRRIKANDDAPKKEKTVAKKTNKPTKVVAKTAKKSSERGTLIGYFKGAWAELKLVRWPTRKETWKMTAAVLVFSITFAIFVVVLDGLFTFMFKSILGK